MKIVFFEGENVIDTISGVSNVTYDCKNIYWKDGSMTGVNCNFVVLEDDEEFTTEKVLAIKREIKKKELNDACNKTILGKFPSIVEGTTYYFSNDTEAQINFDKADGAFYRNRISETPWTAYDENGTVVRLNLTATTFEPVYLDHLFHIQNNISKLRDILEPQVNNAVAIEEIKAIVW